MDTDTVGVLGALSLHLIKETWTLREEGGAKLTIDIYV